MVCVSGLVCVLLEKNWISISQSSKTPLYALLGTAMAFAWCFGIVDALNQGLCLWWVITYPLEAGIGVVLFHNFVFSCCRCFFVNKKAFIRSFSNSPHQVCCKFVSFDSLSPHSYCSLTHEHKLLYVCCSLMKLIIHRCTLFSLPLVPWGPCLGSCSGCSMLKTRQTLSLVTQRIRR